MKVYEIFLLLSACFAISEAEVDDLDQQKRGFNKGPILNSIPLSQKPEQLTYYPQPPVQQQLGPIFPQTNTYYPNVQAPVVNNQLYQQQPQQQESPVYQHQPQTQLPTNQLIPYNFAPNPTYQRIQIIPLKSANGQLQISLIPQHSYLTPPPQVIAQPSYSQNQYQTLPSHPQFTIPQTPQYYQQPFQFTPPYIGQPSQLLMISQQPAAQPFQFGNPYISATTQSLLNYFQNNQQAKQQLLYNTSFGNQYQGSDFEKSAVQNVQKDDNEISASGNDYSTSENGNFKSSFGSNSNTRSSYTP